MLYRVLLIAIYFISTTPIMAQEIGQPVQVLKNGSDLETISDLNKFMGTWYEIARLRFPWDSFCAHNTLSIYTKTGEKSFNVLTQCQTGKTILDVQKANGVGEVVDNTTNAKMKLNFNYFNAYRWVFSGDYWIIQLADDYSYAVITEPTQKQVMILSRTPHLPTETYEDILARLVLQLPNMNVLNMMRTIQDK